MVYERCGRLTEAITAGFLRAVAWLDIGIDRAPDSAAGLALALARAHRLRVYDAANLELAQRAAAPLATLDAALARAARGEGVALIEA